MPDTKHRIRLLKRDRKLNLCYIFSCDDTCNLDVVETLLSGLKEKHGIGIHAFRNRFGLSQSSEMCESIIPDLPKDFAIFVVHANENRLSINDNNDGTGYSMIYRALLEATYGKVLIIIDGDDNYRDSAEEQSTVLSRWARRRVSSQFNDEFMDGRKSFIFSWNKEHRPIHVEAMLHFFDPGKKGEKFVPKPKVEATVAPEDPKKTVNSQERGETDVKATKTKQNSSNIQAQIFEDMKYNKESDSFSVDVPSPEEEAKEENVKCFRLFNCDHTYKLHAVEKLLDGIKKKLSFDISIQEHYFDLRNMSEVCHKIKKKELPMDFAIFVVHAQESRLSINEDNAGIGYAKLYSALLQATEERVLIVIGGDDNYKDSAEEQSTVLSRWARRKVSSQFNDEFLDGRKSFIFSWDKEHRPIHEEAMLHFFDPDKTGKTFVPKPRVEATFPPENPKKVECQERKETDVKSTKIKRNSSDIQKETLEVQKAQKRHEKEVPMHLAVETDESDHSMDTSSDDPVEESLNKPTPTRPPDVRAVDSSASSLPSSVAILYRDQTDIATIKDVFGDVLPAISPITSKNPSDLKTAILNTQSVRSCFIIVEAIKMRDELRKKSHGAPYQDLLRTASNTVGGKVVVILCDNGSNISSSEEETITARIEELLAEKGPIVWWKGTKSCPEIKRSRFSISGSHSCPDGHDGTEKRPAKKGTPAQVASPINSEELILHTRLRHGRISYDRNDVKVRRKEWTAPQHMTEDLLKKFQSSANAELQVYREIETGKETAVVNKGITSHFTGAWETVVGWTSESNIGNYIPSLGGSSNTPPADNDAPPSKDESDDLSVD